MDAFQTGDKLVINPTKTQRGGFLGTLLASIGVPLLLSALTGKGLNVSTRSVPTPPTGQGLSVSPKPMVMMPYFPPPFSPEISATGMGVKKRQNEKTEQGYFLEKTANSTAFRF